VGRSVKYPNIARTYKPTGVVMPTGTTAQRPSAAINGTFRYNTDTSKFELYQNGTWINPTSRGKVAIVKDTFTADGLTVNYTLTQTPTNANAIQVFVGNVHQNPNVAYTVSSSTLTFNIAPPNTQTIEVYHNFDSTDR
jgi:hypothetical protein